MKRGSLRVPTQASAAASRIARWCLIAVVIGAYASANPYTAKSAAAAVPSVYWGAFVPGAPQDPRYMDAFEAHAGKRASLEMFGLPWRANGSYTGFPQTHLQTIRNRGTIPVVDWASWDSWGNRTSQPDFELADIYNGNHDPFLTQFARSAAAWGNPFFVRFDAEMNGWWSPWSEQTNNNRPGDFARAWRHVVDVFRREGATNVTWVFCPNIIGPLSTPLTGLYPGDNYVDWTCLDGYNWGTDFGNAGWWSLTDVFSGSEYTGGFDSYLTLLDLAPTKPIMIGETASSENGGSKANWITSAFTTELPRYFPNIKAVMWFNWNTGDPGITWPIESSPSAQAAFAQAIASPYYAANEFGSIAGGPIKPLSPMVPKPITLNAVADSCTRKTFPTSVACGTSPTLFSDQPGIDTAFVRFDLSSLANKTIVTAKLRIRKSTESWASSITPHDVKLVFDNAWQEQYLSYNNSVPVSNLVLGTFKAPSDTGPWYQVPLPTDLVQSRTGGLLSMAVQGQNSDVLIFYAREAGAANAPQLVVALDPQSSPPPPPTTTTIALNSVADSCTRRWYPTSVACGTSTTLLSDMTGYDTAFLRFDLAPLAGKTISSATLRIRTSTESWAGATVQHVVKLVPDNAWKEQYLSFYNTVSISNVVMATFAAPLANAWYDVPVATTVVQSRAGGLLSMAVEGQGWDVLIFYAREAGPANAPQLVVTYR
jgi:hypothetical protein